MEVLDAGKKRGLSIADVVKEQVHNTTVTKEETIAWIELLLRQLNEQKALLVNNSEKWNEDVLGTLLSASGLTVRYVSQASVFSSYVPEFESIFLDVLRIPNWTKPLVGLKMVSLRGCTRLVECFGGLVCHNTAAIDWSTQAIDIMLADPESSLVIQLLFRPICEHLNVLVQTHSSTVPLMLPLLTNLFRLHTSIFVPSSTLHREDMIEFASFLSILFETILPQIWSTSSLLTMSRQDIPAFQLTCSCTTSVRWEDFFSNSENLTSMTSVVPSLYAVAVLELPSSSTCAPFDRSLNFILSSLSVALQSRTVEGVEQVHGVIESLRDLLLRYIQMARHSVASNQLISIVPTIQKLYAHLADLSKDRNRPRGMKTSLGDIREAGNECLTALMHCLGEQLWIVENESSFLQNVVVKAADPLLFGHYLFVLRPQGSSDERFKATVARVVATLLKGLSQAHRYSKALTIRMVESVGKVASATGDYIELHAPDLASSLLDVYETTSNARQAIVTALSRLFCIAPFEGEPKDLLIQLLSNGIKASKEFALEALCIILRHDKAVTSLMSAQPVAFWLEYMAACTSLFSSEPIFDEDLPIILLHLDVWHNFLDREMELPSQDQTSFKTAVEKLQENAHSDCLSDIESACSSLLLVIEAK
ncbi:hypothetical protein LEN26_015215 [Aphanomyces euteiches]|nr:hypothetical protein LEN26_015215 [Aphanomyces euteiches]KAH9103977.1 hypothetical protein AeMF1_019824 [Aphanomyces euteiches]KAH9187889.1 hypothetical protein AeNC1_010141 [Aphanomyces euteiches]